MVIVMRNLGSPPCTPEDYRIVDGEFLPPERVVVRMTQAESDATVARLGVDARVSWDEGWGCHRIEPGPTLTMADLDALGDEFRGASAVLDDTSPAGRDCLDALIRGIEAGRPPPYAGDDGDGDVPGPTPG